VGAATAEVNEAQAGMAAVAGSSTVAVAAAAVATEVAAKTVVETAHQLDARKVTGPLNLRPRRQQLRRAV